MSELKIDDNAPNFQANSTKGNLSLADLKNSNIVIYFYPKDMTPGCTTQAQEFSKLYSQFQESDTEIIGVSKDNLSSHNKFCEKENIPYPLLLDEEGEICNLYGVIKEKSMFGKKFLGINRSTFLIDKNRKVIKIWKSVKASGHAQKVLDAIKQMT
ncbi:MAG: peroxiredoxin [Rickettsiales bacterium]|nr:peroxiredoxin [Rickettsiales bacterium]